MENVGADEKLPQICSVYNRLFRITSTSIKCEVLTGL